MIEREHLRRKTLHYGLRGAIAAITKQDSVRSMHGFEALIYVSANFLEFLLNCRKFGINQYSFGYVTVPMTLSCQSAMGIFRHSSVLSVVRFFN